MIRKLDTVKNEEFYTNKYQEEQLDKELYDTENKRSFRLWVFKKDDENRVIDSVGFNNIVIGGFLSWYYNEGLVYINGK